MQQGVNIPHTIFHYRVRDDSIGGDNPFRWQDVSSADIFSGKRVVVFSLPGAFTPTCSTYQVPSFEAAYEKILAQGIDEVYVLSVNDTFVMRKWMLDQQVKKIKFIPDGNGEFTRQLGMLVAKDNVGFGSRSWRYAMVVNNGVIEHWLEEPGREDNHGADPYGVSSAETVLTTLQQSPAN
ncbi:MAG: peroxiredoxin [Gammaproteobacteria bacterium]|nr:peroxiredoxin [Gammaproteobacteria bacterium]